MAVCRAHNRTARKGKPCRLASHATGGASALGSASRTGGRRAVPVRDLTGPGCQSGPAHRVGKWPHARRVFAVTHLKHKPPSGVSTATELTGGGERGGFHVTQSLYCAPRVLAVAATPPTPLTRLALGHVCTPEPVRRVRRRDWRCCDMGTPPTPSLNSLVLSCENQRIALALPRLAHLTNATQVHNGLDAAARASLEVSATLNGQPCLLTSAGPCLRLWRSLPSLSALADASGHVLKLDNGWRRVRRTGPGPWRRRRGGGLGAALELHVWLRHGAQTTAAKEGGSFATPGAAGEASSWPPPPADGG